MVRVLVIGASGFIGRVLLREFFSHGRCKLFGVDRSNKIPLPMEQYFQGDVADERFLHDCIDHSRPDLIYFLLADWGGTGKTLQTMENLFSIARFYPNVIIIHAGSSAQYGRVPAADQPVSEKTPFNPVSQYGRIKVAEELKARELADRFGIGLIVTRIFNVTGPCEPERLVGGALVRRIKAHMKHNDLKIGLINGSFQRDFLDVRDVASALRAVGLHRESGSIFNICSGEVMSIREYLDKILDGFGVKDIFQVVPQEFGRKPGIRYLLGDNSKLKRQTGWVRKFAIEQTIGDLIASATDGNG